MCITDISSYRVHGNDIIDPFITYPILGIKYTHPSASTTPTSSPSHESMGNGVVGMREGGDTWNLKLYGPSNYK